MRIDTPTQNLESYFLEVVQRARESAETSGATSGNRVAAYLRGDAEPAAASAKILERLAAPAPKIEAAEPVTPATPSANDAKLEALTRPAAAAPVEPKPEPEPEVDLAKANEKLSSLLNKPK